MKDILKSGKYAADGCPIRNVLARFGDKWSLLVLLLLGEGEAMRFTHLHHTIEGISQKMLTVTLRSLAADGLVQRTVFAEVPLRVEYQITELGNSLLPHIHGLVDWAKANMQCINQAREAATA